MLTTQSNALLTRKDRSRDSQGRNAGRVCPASVGGQRGRQTRLGGHDSGVSGTRAEGEPKRLGMAVGLKLDADHNGAMLASVPARVAALIGISAIIGVTKKSACFTE
jgi:hypothetical protein